MPKALVVENDLTSRELLARVLRLKGLDAHTAIGVPQAAALLLEARAPYDLIIVDLDLATADGVELLRHVAALPDARRPTQVIAISQSLAPFYPRLTTLQLPLETLQKPVHLPSLMKIVEGLGRKAEDGR
jgi:CheY-like chemotaxis protein